ncbi:MAG: DNA primase large subunit PriL [Candidatus Thermoplasmatota archaeon]|nr:DNA primase large subunit PriL [Candidatus Thermoplasmatota archaeon]
MPEYWRYPFLPSASKILDGISLNSLLEDYYYAEARALALSRLETSASLGVIDIEGPPTNDESDIVLSYVVSRLVLAATENQALVNYVALSEARRAERFLSSETDESLVEVASSLGIISVELAGSNFNLNFIDYVRSASNLREGDWKLSNRGVSNGIVTLDRQTFVRLMREVIRQHLEELPDAPQEIKDQFEGTIEELKSKISKTFTERIGGLNNVVGERQAEAMKELGRFDLSKAPPCFNLNLMDLQAGVNLAHPSRFFITTFLSSLNQDPEAVMQLFATAPDFKEAYTRYQVEHITGKTSNTSYSPPKCDTLVSSGVCPGPNALCRQIRHPLSYYRVMAESERDNATRMERILLATLNKEEYPAELLKQNADSLGKFDFNYPEEIESRELLVAFKGKDACQVNAKISYFQGKVYSVDIPGEERKIWITKAVLKLTDGNREYDCLPLTDWKVALPVQEANHKSQEIALVVRPMEIILNDNQAARRMLMILDTAN